MYNYKRIFSTQLSPQSTDTQNTKKVIHRNKNYRNKLEFKLTSTFGLVVSLIYDQLWSIMLIWIIICHARNRLLIKTPSIILFSSP